MTRELHDDAFDVLIEDTIFTAEDGPFAVVRTKRVGSEDMVTAFGDLAGVLPGEVFRVRGRWSEHPTYGRRFRVSDWVPVLPTTAQGIARYLGSGLIAGIGPALAQRLVERFGDRTLEIIANESRRLRDVEGIGKKRADAIAEAVRSRRAEAETLSFLHGVGVGPALGRRILRHFGEDAVRAVRDDPYRVALRVPGMGFRTADRIGRAQGVRADDPRRAAGAVMHVLGEAADEGHTFLPVDELLREAGALDVPEPSIAEAIGTLSSHQYLVHEGHHVYLPHLFRAECAVAKHLARVRAREAGAAPNPTLPKPATPIPLTERQWDAVRATVLHPLVVLTGGPGTGKTTTVRAIVDAHRAAGHRVALAAPTGRAAKRLSEATGAEAKTIHRLLEWNPATGRFLRDERAPLEAELVLIDESSMLDVLLAERLFAAVPTGATLVLVGDVDQLPPVGPGPVLRDVLATSIAEVVRLTEIFRQAQASAIVRGAHAVLRGEVPPSSEPGATAGGDFFILPTTDPTVAIERLQGALRRAHEAYGFDPKSDLQVLTPMRRGPLGTDELNHVLQATLNPGAPSTTGPGARFRPGDKVMQLRNDYDRDVYNGDIGEVRRVEGGVTYVLVDGREVQYSMEALDALQLAYACTVHKVQGSEFPAIIVMLHASHHVLLSRALLYTAVTRAKRLVVVIGDPRALRRAVENAQASTTHSGLRARLAETVAPQQAVASKTLTTPS